MEKVLSLQLLEVAEGDNDDPSAGSLASAGCDRTV